MKKLLIMLGLSFSAAAELPAHSKELIKIENTYYSILYNCEKRGYEHYYYATQPDTGNVKRKSSFFQDDRLPKHCQQKTTFSYKTTGSQPKFHRGHGVPANHMDFDKKVSDSTNSFSNVVPQSAALNSRGLWRHTDMLIECSRSDGKDATHKIDNGPLLYINSNLRVSYGLVSGALRVHAQQLHNNSVSFVNNKLVAYMSSIILTNLSKIRLDIGYTQEILSELSGISVRTIQRIESGKSTSLETAKCLSSTLNLTNYHELLDAQQSVTSYKEYSSVQSSTYDFITEDNYSNSYVKNENIRLIRHFLLKAFVPVPFIYMILYIFLSENQAITNMSEKELLIGFLAAFVPVIIWIVSVSMFFKHYLNPIFNKLKREGADISIEEFSTGTIFQYRFKLTGGVSLYMNKRVIDLPCLAKKGDANSLAILGVMLCDGRFLKQDVSLGLEHLSLAAKQGSAYAAFYIAREIEINKIDYLGSANKWYCLSGELGLINTQTLSSLKDTKI